MGLKTPFNLRKETGYLAEQEPLSMEAALRQGDSRNNSPCPALSAPLLTLSPGMCQRMGTSGTLPPGTCPGLRSCGQLWWPMERGEGGSTASPSPRSLSAQQCGRWAQRWCCPTALPGGPTAPPEGHGGTSCSEFTFFGLKQPYFVNPQEMLQRTFVFPN